MPLRFGILTLSDRAAQGERDDQSGPALAHLVLTQNWVIVKQAILPDDESAIRATLIEWCDAGNMDIVLTTGGTGFAPRDVTPEATLSVVERHAPGIAEAMRVASLTKTPHAMLSRSTAGIRKKTLIINLPGSPKGAVENLEIVLPVLSHAIHLLNESPEGDQHS